MDTVPQKLRNRFHLKEDSFSCGMEALEYELDKTLVPGHTTVQEVIDYGDALIECIFEMTDALREPNDTK